MYFHIHTYKVKVPGYFIASFIFHFILLFWLGKVLPASHVKETSLALEIIPAPVVSQPKPVKTVQPKPKQSSKTIAQKPIPQEEHFPPPPLEVKEKNNFKLFEENLKGKAKVLKKITDVTEKPVKAAKKSAQVPPSKPVAKQTNNIPTAETDKTTGSAEPQKDFAIQTEDLFKKQVPRSTSLATKKKKPDFGQLLKHLDNHLEVEKYANAGYAGEGLLSFEDTDFRSVWYGRIVKKKVIDGWFPPYAARVLGLTGRTIISFRIQRNGEIINVKIKDSSGDETLDKAALNAIKNAAPFPGLPSDYHYDTLGVIFSFWYNLKPPQG